MRRREILLGLSATVALSGCTGFWGNEPDTPLVIENHDTSKHTVAVTFFRGAGYDSKAASVEVSPDGRHESESFVPSNDWNYPFVLDIELDGEHALTSQHRWDPNPVTVTVRSDGKVQVDNRLRGTPTRPLREWQNRSSSTPE
jgi:hypothetical protein